MGWTIRSSSVTPYVTKLILKRVLEFSGHLRSTTSQRNFVYSLNIQSFKQLEINYV